MSDFKTNYFGSFLDAVRSSPSGNNGGLSSGPAIAVPAFPAHPPALGVADNVLMRLEQLGGEASFQELLPAAGQSIDALAAAFSKLQLMELAVTAGAKVKITDAGKAQAQTLRTM